MSNYLNDKLQKTLRLQKVITENEVVSKEGDLYIAVNVLNNTRRVLDLDLSLIRENAVKILKG